MIYNEVTGAFLDGRVRVEDPYSILVLTEGSATETECSLWPRYWVGFMLNSTDARPTNNLLNPGKHQSSFCSPTMVFTNGLRMHGSAASDDVGSDDDDSDG